MHRQRGLADPGHPANRDDLHHATWHSLADVVCQPCQLRSPAGEGRNITRQGLRRGRRESARQYRIVAASAGFTIRSAPGGGLEHAPLRPGQTQHVGQHPGCMAAGRRADPRSRSLTVRGLTWAASASCSCVSPASALRRLSSGPKLDAAQSATGPTALTDPCAARTERICGRRAEQCLEYDLNSATLETARRNPFPRILARARKIRPPISQARDQRLIL